MKRTIVVAYRISIEPIMADISTLEDDPLDGIELKPPTVEMHGNVPADKAIALRLIEKYFDEVAKL